MAKTGVFIKTWGCTLNQSDSDLMRAILRPKGFNFARSERSADVVILNTCTVKAATENKIIGHLRSLVSQKRKVVVAGCLAVNQALVSNAAPNAPLVAAGSTDRIAEAVRLAIEGKGGVFNSIPKGAKPLLHPIREFSGPVARIPIQEGCVGSCAFCQTKLARPGLISQRPKDVIRAIESAASSGVKEIQLTGMDTGAYGLDLGTDLALLLSEAVKVKGDFKIRLGMINPEHVRRMQSRLIPAFRSPKMYKFLHMPVQTGSEAVCRAMGRNHTVSDFALAASDFRGQIPGIAIATDIISGYPTEGEADHEATIALLESVRPELINLSRFTPRPGTAAKALRQLPTQISKRRVTELHAICRKIALEGAQKYVGARLDVLVCERGKAGQMKGKAPNYMQVALAGENALMGKTIRVEITGARAYCLFGKQLSIR